MRAALALSLALSLALPTLGCEAPAPQLRAQPRAREASPPPTVSADREPRLTVVEVGERDARDVFVLLHGYGAPGDDLVPLAESLAARVMRPLRVVVPAAPIAMGASSRAWYPLDDEARATSARDRLEALLRELEAEGVSRDRVIVGGFSQGAMMSIELALSVTPPIRGIVVLSGRMLDHHAPEELRALDGVAVFWAHGRVDPRVPFERGLAFADRAEAAGARVERHAFDGRHTIPPAITEDLAAWLERTFAE